MKSDSNLEKILSKGIFAVTGVYHRYFSHRTYETSRWFQFLLAFVAQSSAQRGALWWAAHRRDEEGNA